MWSRFCGLEVETCRARGCGGVAPPDRLDVQYEGKSGVIPIRKVAGSINGRRMSVAQPNPVQHLLDPSGLPDLVELTAIVGGGHVAGRSVRIVSAKKG